MLKVLSTSCCQVKKKKKKKREELYSPMNLRIYFLLAPVLTVGQAAFF